jgi:peptide/nickel transport system substrate-binding protein
VARPFRSRSRRVLAGGLAALAWAAACLAAACGGQSGPPREEVSEATPQIGGTAIFGVNSDVDSFNEFVKTSQLADQIDDFMLFMSLVRYDAKLAYAPYLARSWELAPDGSSVTFHLRSDVRWHDGVAVRAEDVIFTYHTALLDAVAYPQRAYFRRVRDALALDSLTVRFDFVAPHAEPLDPFTQWSVMPAHLLSGVAPAEMSAAAFNRAPVGCGPFKFDSWKPNQSITFVANPDFPADLGGRPYLDRVVFRILPEETTLLTELRAGTVDIMRAVPPRDAGVVDADPNLRLVTFADRSFNYIAWNTRDPLFADPLVRLALSLAIDREQLVNALLYGYGETSVSYVLPDVAPWAVDPDLKPLPYAPDSARTLLARAGWRDTDGDGVLDRAGRPFRFTLKTNKGNDVRADAAVIVQADLKKVGVDVAPRLVEWAVFLNEINHKQFEAYLSSWVYDSFQLDPSDVFHTRAIDGKYNRASYSNPVVDSLIDAGLAATDRATARPLWFRFQRILRDEAPYTFLFNDKERAGLNRRLHGADMDARGYLVNVARWWIPESERRF